MFAWKFFFGNMTPFSEGDIGSFSEDFDWQRFSFCCFFKQLDWKKCKETSLINQLLEMLSRYFTRCNVTNVTWTTQKHNQHPNIGGRFVKYIYNNYNRYHSLLWWHTKHKHNKISNHPIHVLVLIRAIHLKQVCAYLAVTRLSLFLHDLSHDFHNGRNPLANQMILRITCFSFCISTV